MTREETLYMNINKCQNIKQISNVKYYEGKSKYAVMVSLNYLTESRITWRWTSGHACGDYLVCIN